MERKNLESSQEAALEASKAAKEAEASGKWLVAVFKAEGEEVTLINRITWEFPISKLLVASELLRNDCQRELEACPVAAFGTPLQRAVDMAVGDRSVSVGNHKNPCEPERFLPYGVVDTEESLQRDDPDDEESGI